MEWSGKRPGRGAEAAASVSAAARLIVLSRKIRLLLKHHRDDLTGPVLFSSAQSDLSHVGPLSGLSVMGNGCKKVKLMCLVFYCSRKLIFPPSELPTCCS